MDELAKVIEQEIRDCVDGPPRPGCSGNVERIAAAVRSFLLSEERVEAVARSLCIASISGGHPDDITLMERPLWTEWEHDAIAALTAAIGEGK